MSQDAIRYVQHLADAKVLDPEHARYAVALALAELIPERAHTVQVRRKELMALTGLSVRTVREALRHLEAMRIVQTTEQRLDRTNAPSLYTFVELAPAGDGDHAVPWPLPAPVLDLRARQVLLEHAERLRQRYAPGPPGGGAADQLA